MSKKSAKNFVFLTFFIPRVLNIFLIALFVSLFIFNGLYPLGMGHLYFAFILSLFLFLSWQSSRFGVISFAILGPIYMLINIDKVLVLSSFFIAIYLLLIALFFLIDLNKNGDRVKKRYLNNISLKPRPARSKKP